jgi:hypothetical protein
MKRHIEKVHQRDMAEFPGVTVIVPAEDGSFGTMTEFTERKLRDKVRS